MKPTSYQQPEFGKLQIRTSVNKPTTTENNAMYPCTNPIKKPGASQLYVLGWWAHPLKSNRQAVDVNFEAMCFQQFYI